jgi:transcriptional regulator with XRE-family HTH domain
MASIKKARPTRVRIKMTPGEMVRTTRVLQEMSPLDLAKAAGITRSILAAIEDGRTPLGVKRAERLARALRVHPAVLVWPQWEASEGFIPNKKTAAAMKESRRGGGRRFKTVEALMAELNR